MPELTEVEVQEVSLVDRAANKRKFLMLKAQGKGAKNMNTNELILDVEEGMEDIIKAIALVEDPGEQEAEIEKMAALSDKSKRACKMALRLLNAVKTDMPNDIMKKLAEMAGYGYAAPEKKEATAKQQEGYAKPQEDEQTVEQKKAKAKAEEDKLKAAAAAGKGKTNYGYKLKKDGTPDFEDMPQEMRPMVESLWKQSEDSIRKAQALENTLHQEREERRTKEFIAKAAGFEHLSIEADKFGPILKKVAEALDETEFNEMNRILKAADDSLGVVFKEIGSNNEPDESNIYVKIDKEAVKIAKRDGITREQGYVKALDENPELAKQERLERDKHSH